MTPERQVTAHESMLGFYVQHKQKTQVEMDNLVHKKDRHLRFCPADFAAESFTTKLRNKHVDVLHLEKVIRDLARNRDAILARNPDCHEPGSYWLSPPNAPPSRGPGHLQSRQGEWSSNHFPMGTEVMKSNLRPHQPMLAVKEKENRHSCTAGGGP
jgi:hypothetical protein